MLESGKNVASPGSGRQQTAGWTGLVPELPGKKAAPRAVAKARPNSIAARLSLSFQPIDIAIADSAAGSSGSG
jgi:hypothetical protein